MPSYLFKANSSNRKENKRYPFCYGLDFGYQQWGYIASVVQPVPIFSGSHYVHRLEALGSCVQDLTTFKKLSNLTPSGCSEACGAMFQTGVWYLEENPWSRQGELIRMANRHFSLLLYREPGE